MMRTGMKAGFTLATVLLLAVGVPALAADPGFLPQSSLYDPAALLPPPPAAGSPQAETELAEVKHYQATATPAQLALAKSDNDNENGTIYAGVLGPGWDLTKLPATAKMLGDVTGSEGGFTNAPKAAFHRDRPWVVDPSIQTCAMHRPSQDHASYPSGHATRGYGMGIVLAHLMPNHAQAIMARTALFAENRLVCGFHFRSDIVAGQEYGTLMAFGLMQNPKFQSEMSAAQTELHAAGLAP
jgi:acid phosphatase (class A)